MPEDLKRTTGTSDTDGRDAGADTRTTGTTADEDRDADKGKKPETDPALVLEWKAKAERTNQLESELAQARAQIDAGIKPAPDTDDRTQREIEAIEMDNAELRRLSPHDPVARATLRNNELLLSRLEDLQQATLDAFTLQGVPEDKRQSVHSFYEKNRKHFRDMSEAVRYLKNRDTEAENKTLKERVAELEKNGGGKGGRDDKDDTVRTGGRDLSSTSHKARTVTMDAFEARQRELREAGDYATARDEQLKLRRGEIVFKG